MKELKILIEKYERAKVKFNKYRIYKLVKKRERLYESLLESDIKNIQEIILEESRAFLQLLKYSILATQKSSDFYNVLSLFNDFDIANATFDKKTRDTVNAEKFIILKDILSILKEHPHKAGIKVMYIKDMLKQQEKNKTNYVY